MIHRKPTRQLLRNSVRIVILHTSIQQYQLVIARLMELHKFNTQSHNQQYWDR